MEFEIFLPILVKKALNSVAISFGSVKVVPLAFIFSIFSLFLLRPSISLKVFQVFLTSFALFGKVQFLRSSYSFEIKFTVVFILGAGKLGWVS